MRTNEVRSCLKKFTVSGLMIYVSMRKIDAGSADDETHSGLFLMIELISPCMIDLDTVSCT